MGLFTWKKKEEKKVEGLKKVEAKDLDLDSKKQENKKAKKQTTTRPAKPTKKELKKFEEVDGVLVKPLVTEKSSNLGAYNQYAFSVNPKANKIQIKKAIETYYHVKPVKVNIIKVRGKNIRWGRTRGMTRSWKKAVVTLRSGDKIELYEGV